MFEYVKLKNFKSFGDVTFNLLDKNNNVKKLILIYGENGIGKSNLSSAFYMLSETLRTMDVRDMLEDLLENTPEHLSDERFMSFFKDNFRDIETLIKENKMISSEDNLYMEFGFNLKGKSGRYILEMDNQEIVKERLEYILVKNKGILFELNNSRKFLSEKIFDKELINDLQILIDKFWGKHSFLSILDHDISDKSSKYYKNKISDNLYTVLKFLHKISCSVKFGNKNERGVLGLPDNYIPRYSKGHIDIEDEEKLDKTQKMLNLFLTSIYKDIESVFYKKEFTKKEIKYNLFVNKNIYGKVRTIDFKLESTGTQSIIELLPYMLLITNNPNSIAIIDEFDIGMHDILVKNLVTSLYNHIEGQLIMTTHNTLLMESDIPNESVYVINELDDHNKEIECILKYDNKIHPNTNVRKQYIQGKYKGIPEEIKIDFHKLGEIL